MGFIQKMILRQNEKDLYIIIFLCCLIIFLSGCAGSKKNLRSLDNHKRLSRQKMTGSSEDSMRVYFEEFSRVDDAFYREKQVQGWSRKKKEALIAGKQYKLPALAKKNWHKKRKNIIE